MALKGELPKESFTPCTVCVCRNPVKKLVVDGIGVLPDGFAALPIGFLFLVSTDTRISGSLWRETRTWKNDLFRSWDRTSSSFGD
jgi:hypothetical protein